MDLNLSITPNKENNSVEIIYSGNLTLETVIELKEKIEPIYNKNSILKFEFIDVEEIDLSGIQMIYSLKKKNVTEQKNVQIHLEIANEMQNLLTRTGFTHLIENKF